MHLVPGKFLKCSRTVESEFAIASSNEIKLLTLIRNITIATFSTFGLYKKEAYDANLWAGKVLSDHGVPVAYKSVSFPPKISL